VFFQVFFFPILIVTLIFFSASQVYGEEIGVIISQDIPLYRQALIGFRKVVAGKVKEYDLKGDPNEAGKVISMVKNHPPDLILSIGLLAARVAKEDLKEVPAVFCMVYHPERFSLSGKGMTGVSLDIPLPEQFSKMKELFPEIKRVGVLYDPQKTGKVIDQAKEVSKEFGISLIPVKVRSEKELPESFRTLPGTIDLLWVVPDSTVVTARSIEFILLTSFESNIPIFTFSEDLVRKGAVAGFSSDYEAAGEEAGHLALRVLKGESPDQIPIRFVSKQNLSINLKIARKMGIKFKPETLQSAQKVYE
jgi:putative ABC transport system substrate-binding protein